MLRAPKPYLLKNNIIVMEFIGENGIGAPRLRDALDQIQDIQQTYVDVLFMIRGLYQKCKLVHADLSEYNMLYFKNQVYVIDVSQSVEHDHPMALDFLRRDCQNISEFFKKLNVQVLNNRDTFDFITDINITNENEYLSDLFKKHTDH